jgi:hypothetical protein
LVDELDDHEQEDEYAEHLVLQTLHGVVAVEERKPNQQRAANGQDSLRIDV